MKREVVNAILDLKEYNRFSKGIFQWVGFETKWLEYENIERQKEKVAGHFGNCSNTPLKELFLLQQLLFI